MSYEYDYTLAQPETDDGIFYLFEVPSYESLQYDTSITEDGHIPSGKIPVAALNLSDRNIIRIPFEKRMLFAKFIPAVKVNGVYVPCSQGTYISNPEMLAKNQEPYILPKSKKGLLLDASTIGTNLLSDLNVERVVYNIPISLILGESTNDQIDTITYEYNGKTYSFDGYRLAGFDTLFRYLSDNGYHITAIILNDRNSQYPEIIHPFSRNKSYKSEYYAFNTEEEDGVRLMEAVALFLSERYSCSEYGFVSDWVIGNEINQQKVWNYMATDDLEYYADSFERSFRTFYNAIRSNYANAHVSFSIDHDWNDNYGDNGRFFNARDFICEFNKSAKEFGNYDWGVSIHPYPQPLPKVKFWENDYAKTEDTPVLTPMNLSAITDMMRQEELLDTKGNVRDLGVTEVGFSSRSGEELQAAAFAYSYYIIDDNDYISSYLLNRQCDDEDSLKSGLAIGIYNADHSPKLLAEVFANIDGAKGKEFIPKMLEIIGEDSLEEALIKAR